MSCVVGYVNKDTGQMYIGGDSAAIHMEKLDIRIRNDEKVFSKNNMLFGFVGSCRMGQVLRYSFEIPEKPEKMSDMAYLCSIFVRNLIDCLKENDALQNENGELSIDGEFMVGYNENIYIISSDFQVISEDGQFCCIGCAAEYAQGAFYALDYIDEQFSEIDTQTKIIAALETAAKYSAGVREPFKIVTLKSETNCDPSLKT